MSTPAPQPPSPSFLDLDYAEAALETAAGLKKISKFATRLEDWFDLWSEHIIMPPLGVMQQAASLISRMTSVRKTLAQALNSFDPADFNPPPDSPDPDAGSPSSPEEPPRAPTPSLSPSDALLNEVLRLSNGVYAQARSLAKAAGIPAPSPSPLDLDLDLDPDSTPTPSPLHASVPTTPNLSIQTVRSCPTIPLDQLPAAAAALETKLQTLMASSSPQEEFNKLPEPEATELLDHIQKTYGDGWSPTTFSPQKFPPNSPSSFSLLSSIPPSSSTNLASPPIPYPRHPPPGS